LRPALFNTTCVVVNSVNPLSRHALPVGIISRGALNSNLPIRERYIALSVLAGKLQGSAFGIPFRSHA